MKKDLTLIQRIKAFFLYRRLKKRYSTPMSKYLLGKTIEGATRKALKEFNTRHR